MKRRLFVFLLLFSVMLQPVKGADFIKWVDFQVGLKPMQRALELDIQSHEQEKAVSWIEILALASTYHGGSPSVQHVNEAYEMLCQDQSPKERLGEQYKLYSYYHDAYDAALGGLVGSYAIEKEDDSGQKIWAAQYGLKAFSPIAAGYWYSHYSDFGNSRSYGFARRHLGNDLMGSLGTPIVAVETGTVEAMGWNQYGGWRVGIRSLDGRRYYYYAHLKKDAPFAPGLKEGDRVTAGDLIGFMGRTGYSTRENVNNIDAVHLHFGLELIFDESQKECNSEIWIDVYPIVQLLSAHRSSIAYSSASGTWERLYPYRDLDLE